MEGRGERGKDEKQMREKKEEGREKVRGKM